MGISSSIFLNPRESTRSSGGICRAPTSWRQPSSTATGVGQGDRRDAPASGGALAPLREVARRVEGLAGRVTDALARGASLRLWAAHPPKSNGGDTNSRRHPQEARRSLSVPLVRRGGSPRSRTTAISGQFEAREGMRGLLALAVAPVTRSPSSSPGAIRSRRDSTATSTFWRRWSARSHLPRPLAGGRRAKRAGSQATGVRPLPEPSPPPRRRRSPRALGGERNWDYRFSWIRDSSFTLDSITPVGLPR